MQNRETAENIVRALLESGFLIEELDGEDQTGNFNAIIDLVENELDYDDFVTSEKL